MFDPLFVCFSEYFWQESYLNNNKQTSSSQRKCYITFQHYDAHVADILDLSELKKEEEEERSRLVLVHTKELKDFKVLQDSHIFCTSLKG